MPPPRKIPAQSCIDLTDLWLRSRLSSYSSFCSKISHYPRNWIFDSYEKVATPKYRVDKVFVSML